MYVAEDDEGNPLVETGSEEDFLKARNGDSLICPFECDYCGFERLTARSPDLSLDQDKTLMMCIRQANLDAFWSRRPGTVSKSRLGFLYHRKTSELLGFIPFPFAQPMPKDCNYGLEYAVTMLWKSLDKGRHEERVKFATIRSIRTMASNVEIVFNAAQKSRSLVQSGRSVRLESSLPADSEWLKRFLNGMRFRIGERLRQDLALTPEIIVEVLSICEEQWTLAQEGGFHDLAKAEVEIACFFILSYAGGLRGFEVPKVVVHGLVDQFVEQEEDGRPPHVGVPLRGRFKGREGITSNLIIFLVQRTNSGVEVGRWLKRMVNTLEREGITSGWMFRGDNGAQAQASFFRPRFYEKLLEAKERSPHLFAPGVDVMEDYGHIRSCRRGADVQAVKEVKNRILIDMFFRWNTGGDETSQLPMHLLYAEKKRMVNEFLQVSQML